MFFLDNDGRLFSPVRLAPQLPPPPPPKPPAPKPQQVAPVKSAIYRGLQNGKSLKAAMQAAQHDNPKLEQQALLQAALLAQEEWQAAQAAAHPPKPAPKAAPKQSAPKQPTAKQPTAKHSAPKQSESKQPAAKQPATKRPAAKQAAPKQPATPHAPPDPLVQARAKVAATGLAAPADLAQAANALEHPVAPVGVVAAPSAAPTGAQVQIYVDQIGQHEQEGMTPAQAINATRIDQGGAAQNEQALAEAALALQGSKHLDAISNGQDPIAAGDQDLAALKVFQPKTLAAAQTVMRAPKQGQDRDVTPAVAALRQLQTDTAAHASAAKLATDRATLHAALGNQLTDLYGSNDAFLNDPTQIDKLWQGEYQTLRDDVVAYFRAPSGTQEGAGPSAQSVNQQAQSLYTSIEAAVIMRETRDAQGGKTGTNYVQAAQTLTADLQAAGAAPGSALANEIIGSDPAHPADAAVATLTHEASAQVAAQGAPALVCTAHDDGNPTNKLAALSNALMPYQGTVIDAPLIDSVKASPSTQMLFNLVAPSSLMQQANAHEKLAQVANVLDAAKTSPALANALYDEKFRGSGPDSKQGGVLYWAAHATDDDYQKEYYANLGRIYDDLGGPQSSDAVALRGIVAERMDNDGNAVKTGDTITPMTRGAVLGYDSGTTPAMTPQYGLGDVKSDGDNMQLYQDILDVQPHSVAGKEIATETKFTAGGARAWANTAQAQRGAGLDTVAPADGLQAVTSHAQLVNTLGQAFNLTPQAPHSNADWRAQQNGTFVAYNENQKVYGDTTLADMVNATERGAGISQGAQGSQGSPGSQPSNTTPLALSALPLNYWANGQDPQKDAPKQLSLIDLQGSAGQQTYVGPADTTARTGYTDWQSNNGFAKGQIAVLPALMPGAGGQPLTGAAYWLDHQTGSDHWYDWDHIKTDLEVVGTVAAVALATFVAPEGAPLWLSLMSEAADAYLTYQAVAGATQAVQAMYTKGPDGSYGYQHWQTYLQFGANAFGALVGAGGLGARTAGLLGRVGSASRLADTAATGAKVSDGVAQALLRKSIVLPAVGLNLTSTGLTGWQIADAMIHGQDVSASQKLQFALSAALMVLPFGVRGQIGSAGKTASPAPRAARATAAGGTSTPSAVLVLADGTRHELGAPAHDYEHGTPTLRVQPQGSKLSHVMHGVGSAMLLPLGMVFPEVVDATGLHNGLLDIFRERSWPSLGGKMRSVVSKTMSLTLKAGLHRALQAAQQGDAAEVERQMGRLLAHRSRLGLPEFAGHVLPILSDTLHDAALAKRSLDIAKTSGRDDPATAAFTAQAQARYDKALKSFNENRAKVGKTAFATTYFGRAMRRASMLLAAIGAGDALADPSLLPAQKALYVASGLISTTTQWYYMHAMLDYARNPNDDTLAVLNKASKWNDRVYAANFLIDASLGGISEGRAELLSGALSFSQAAGEGTFYLSTRRLPTRAQIIAAGAGLFLMVGSAAASHISASQSPSGKRRSAPGTSPDTLAPWRLSGTTPTEASPYELASMPGASPWDLPYAVVSALNPATHTLWGIAQSHSGALLRQAPAGSGADPLMQLAALNPQFDWSLDAPGLSPAYTARGQNPNLVFPGEVVWTG